MMEKKRCSKCGVLKDPEEFYRRTDRRNGNLLQAWCKECSHAAGREWHANNRDRGRESYLRRVYNLSIADYETLLAAQGNVCAICKARPGKKNFAVDHSHACCPGRSSCGNCVRGILCSKCNKQVLGGAERNYKDKSRAIVVLKNAIGYLNDPPAKGVINGRETADR